MPEISTTSGRSASHHPAPARTPAPTQAATPVTPVTPIQVLLRTLAPNAEIRAVVVAQDARGLTELKTELGTITVQSPARLPVGSPVTLRIDGAGAEPRLLISRSTERVVGQEQPRSAAAELAPGQSAAAATPRNLTPVTLEAGRSSIARAIVLSSGPLPGTNAPPVADAAGVATLAVAPTDAVLVPNHGPAPARAQASPGQPFAAPPSARQPAPQAPAAANGLPAPPAPFTESSVEHPSAARPGASSSAPPPLETPPARGPLLATGAELAVRIIGTAALHATADDQAFAADHAPQQAASQRGAPITVHARIDGLLPRGEAILRTEFGRLAVNLPAAWAHVGSGEALTIELLPPSMAPATPPPLLERGMPALRGLEAAFLAGQMPAEAVGLPRPGPRLARQLIRFVEAARGGSAEPIFGLQDARHTEAANALGTLAPRAAAELQEAASPPEQPREWRLVMLPLMTETGMTPLRFFSRKQEQSQSRGKTEDAARFVIECDHKALGAVAIDGLVHGKRIDVIVKTEGRLESEAKHDLLALYDDAVAAMGFVGELRFQDDAPVARIPLAARREQRLGLTA
jgi:hypothetical protein